MLQTATAMDPIVTGSIHPPLFTDLAATLYRSLASAPAEILDRCSFEEPETTYGACDGMECRAAATVHHLQSEQDVCLAHFNRMEREQA